MARCIFENLTPAQAEVLASWYEGQGEQDADPWFEEQGVPTPYTDSKKGFYSVLDNGDVIVFCKSIPHD